MNGQAADSPGEAAHVVARNLSAALRNERGYHVHYRPEVRRLVSEAPKQVDPVRTLPLTNLESPNTPLAQLLARRQSGRRFAPRPIGLDDLAHVLLRGVSVRRVVDAGDGLSSYSRPYPSSGNLGSVEVYPVVLDVVGLQPGVYHFDSVRSALGLLHEGCYREWLRRRVFYQSAFSEAAVVLVLTAAFHRLTKKYGERGWRFGHLDAGHVSQTLNLLATERGLAVCTVAGFIDDELDCAVGADGVDEASVLALLIGAPPVATGAQ